MVRLSKKISNNKLYLPIDKLKIKEISQFIHRLSADLSLDLRMFLNELQMLKTNCGSFRRHTLHASPTLILEI